MPSKCYINFDHLDAIYYSGQSLNGTVQLTTHAPKTIRGIHVTVNGYAKVKWNNDPNFKIDHDYFGDTYSAFDQYIDSRTYVVGRKNGTSFEFAPGVYDYTFCCELPCSLPSSISGRYGYIKYEVIVTIDRPFRFHNVFKRKFTVIRELNLNIFPLFWQPKEGFNEKKINAGCCYGKGGIIKTKLRVPISAYAPGQKINFVLEVANESTNDLGKCEVKLNQCLTFETRKPTTLYINKEIILDRKYFPEVLRNSNKKYEDGIIIPLVPPSSSSFDSCIIRVYYALHVTIKIGWFHNNINLELPIVIGTTPLTINTTNDNVITEQPPVSRNACNIT